jgi:hypothetical protein
MTVDEKPDLRTPSRRGHGHAGIWLFPPPALVPPAATAGIVYFE